MEKISINNLAHLGDVIAILILAQNRALENNWIIKIQGPEKYCSILFELFDFTHLKYIGDPNKEININSSIFDLVDKHYFKNNKNYKPSVAFLKIKQFEFKKNENASFPKKIILPTCHLNTEFKEDVCYFQFDSRSIHHGKRQLNENEMQTMLNKFAKNKTKIAIGGIETKHYIKNYEYKLGNIREITENLLQSQQFVGIDSGISHLASLLKIPCDIMLISTIPLQQEELLKLYKFLYPNTNCYILNDLNNFKTFKML